MIDIQHISVSYNGNEVIHDLSLTISTGEFIGLLGPNGAGKSTLLHAISGQMLPDSGKIEFEKKDIYRFNLEYKKQIGFVHEVPFLLLPKHELTKLLYHHSGRTPSEQI